MTTQTVQPIREADQIQKMKSELQKNGTRDYLLFTLGINTGFRVGDLLRLKVEDVKNKTHITIREEKTGKGKRHFISPQLKADIDGYIQSMADHEYLFQSRKGVNQPITRVQAYRILKQAGENLGIDNIGTHTMRKTYGYHHYKNTGDIVMIQQQLNHTSPSVTLRYIGITQDEIDEMNGGMYL